MYTVQIPADLKFSDLERARAFGQAAEQLLNMAEVRTGGVIIRDENFSLLPLVKPVVDRSKMVVGAQDATDELNRLLVAIAASAYRQLPDDHFAAAQEKVAATGEVDLVLVRDLVQQGLYPELADANEFLNDIVSRVASERASGAFRRLTAVKKPKGGR